jgi:hypothetical protein
MEVSCALDSDDWESDDSLCTTAYVGASITLLALFALSIVLVRTLPLHGGCLPVGACRTYVMAFAPAVLARNQWPSLQILHPPVMP